MPSTFYGFEIGQRALSSSQLALDVVGQNIANVSTPGYSRQVVNLAPTDPYTLPDSSPSKPGELGTGVGIASITRVRDAFIDRRVFSANGDQGALGNLRDILGRVEGAYGEPSTTGIGQQMTDFFNSFSDLAANPESSAIRSTVLNKAESLVSAFHSVNTALNQINPEITSKIAVKVGDANALASQIAALNKQIRLSVAAGDQPNDLQDARGVLLDQLSSLVNIQVNNSTNAQTGQPTGEVQVMVGGFSLVQNEYASPLPTTLTSAGGALGLKTAAGDTIPLTSGEIYGLAKATTLVTGYQSDLDTLAYNLVQTVNGIHSTGYGLDGQTGHLLFSTPPPSPGSGTAGAISVSSEVEGNLNAIAAATAPTPPNAFAPGNGDNSRAIAGLVSTPVIGGFSLDSYYNAKVALVGADSRSFQTEADNQDKVVNQLKNQQSSVSGVSLDEELTRMLQYQRSYQAAARVINAMDDVLNRIINGLGAGSTGA